MISDTAIEKLFDQLVVIAEASERCPTNDKINTDALRALVRYGRVRIEVFRENWRVVTILTGQSAGKSTKFYPGGGAPYLVSNKNGTFRNGVAIRPAGTFNASVPSKPHDLSKGKSDV